VAGVTQKRTTEPPARVCNEGGPGVVVEGGVVVVVIIAYKPEGIPLQLAFDAREGVVVVAVVVVGARVESGNGSYKCM
jgi:hypothetical protein